MSDRSTRYRATWNGTLLAESDWVVPQLPGGPATRAFIGRAQFAQMKPGAVLVDVAIDQGGCFETSRPTTHDAPTFTVDGIIHYCVANMPGAVPVTSTSALTNATLPYVLKIADLGWLAACENDSALAAGLNVHEGKIYHAGVAHAFGMQLNEF